MFRLKVFGVALVALFVVGVMTAGAAFAESTPLPQVHTALTGENYPLNLLGQKTATTEGEITLANTTGELPAGTISVLLALSELGSLGTALVLFTEVHEEKNEAVKCSTTGDAPGVVLVPETQWHLVYTSLSPGSELETAGMILVPPFTITCGALKTTTEGPNLGKFVEIPGNSSNGGDSTQIATTTHCASKVLGTQEVSSYFNDNLEELTKQLLTANISGQGAGNSCEEVAGTLLLEVEPGSNASMFTVLL